MRLQDKTAIITGSGRGIGRSAALLFASEGARVAVVDDSCTKGGNLLHAIQVVEEAGCKVVKVLCILDRCEGGSEEIRRRGYDFTALLEADACGNIAPARR